MPHMAHALFNWDNVRHSTVTHFLEEVCYPYRPWWRKGNFLLSLGQLERMGTQLPSPLPAID